jgi:HlyD family secretion protein
VVLAGLAAGAYFIFRKSDKTAVEWKTARVERGDVTVTVTATGTLNALTTVQVGTQVSGTINRILVDFNSQVKQGQVIALLDTTYLSAAVEDASASLERNEIQVNQTKREFDRIKILFDEKVVAQADYDQALSAYETAVSSTRSAKANLNRAKINLKYATITAPISGVIVSRAVDVGQTVAASFNTPTLFTIANDLTKMQLQASIDEADIGKIKVDQEVSFTVDAFENQIFNGTVQQIRLQPTVLNNVVNYTVIIDVPNPDMKLLPGMTANITIKIAEAVGVLKVPASALRFRPPQEYIDKMMENLPDSVKQRFAAKQGTQGTSRSQAGASTTGQGGNMTSPEGQGRRERSQGGTLWATDGASIKAIRVKTGLSDGSYTQVEGKIEEGQEIITGTNAQAAAKTQQQNPFAPSTPGGRR